MCVSVVAYTDAICSMGSGLYIMPTHRVITLQKHDDNAILAQYFTKLCLGHHGINFIVNIIFSC